MPEAKPSEAQAPPSTTTPQGVEVIADAIFVSRVNQRYPFLWAIQSGRCFYCGVAMSLVANKSVKRSMATADHFYPKKLGHHREANVVLACSHCNSSAGHDMPTDEEKARFEKMKEQGNIQARRDVNHATPVQMPTYQGSKRGSFP